MKTLIFILFSTVLLGHTSSAQNAPAQFKSRTANFGKVLEESGKVAYDFQFVNKGKTPLRIEKVVPSCGCTAAEFTQQAIPTDSAGKIHVSYTTINRPGEINKTISVYFQGYETPEVLNLKGIVISPQRLIERELVYPIGNLRFQASTLNLGTVRTNKSENRDFEFFNAGKNTIELKRARYDSTFMQVYFSKTIVKPKETVKIRMTYNALARKNWGLCYDTLRLFTTDDSLAVKTLLITAHIEEHFPRMDEASLAKAPKIKFEKLDQHLGTARSGNSLSQNFKFTNEGKEDLIIRKIIPGCTCISAETPTMVIKPGEVSFIRITLNTANREGVQNKNINIITNSPVSPSINLWIRANVIN